jgi:hypothetical protein
MQCILYTRGLISLWLFKENNKLRDFKKCIYSKYSPLSSTHLCLRCSNFFNPSTKNYFGYAANRKVRKAKALSEALSIKENYILKTKLCKAESSCLPFQRFIIGISVRRWTFRFTSFRKHIHSVNMFLHAYSV